MLRRACMLPVAIVVSLLWTSMAFAGKLEKPTGPVILTVTGNIKETNSKNKAEFDREMLMALGMEKIQTATPWHNHIVTFEGPKGHTLLNALGVDGGTMQVRALNDYVAKVPAKDFMETGAILAMKADGKFMRVRDKGPLFIIYPFDQNEALRNDIYYARAVWQIKSIHIE